MEYVIKALGKGAFEAIQKGEEVEFVAEVELGTDAPLVGRMVDAVLRMLFNRRLIAMRQHMQEEGQNLKKIIESGWKPKSTEETTI
jgi:hypothetical protein